MKATEAQFIKFLKKSPQFVIPIYQRTYSWTKKECKQLWDDIIRAGKDESILAHFVGSIVYVEKGIYQVSTTRPLLVIDGQQRLTTVTLILAALAAYLDKQEEGAREPVEDFSPKKIRNWYLLNPEQEGERHYKLVLSQTDKESLIAMVSGKELPKDYSVRISENYKLFSELIASFDDQLDVVCNGLAKLVVVDISLDRDQDNPQLIFESMNSTGLELSQADLIRNFILMGLEPELQTRLYEHYWRPMEVDFGQEAYATHFDGFMRHYLTVKTSEIPNVRDVYDEFKEYARRADISSKGVEWLVKDIREVSKHFCAMALGTETHPELSVAFQDLRELKVDVAYPFLLELYHDYALSKLTPDEFLQVVRWIEAYVFRRAICNIPTNSMNKTFATFSKSLKKERYLESIQAHFLNLPSYRRFPGNEEFKRDIQTRDLYNMRTRSYFLRRFENFGRKERVVVDEYTIEHIMPQNEDLSQDWQRCLGPEWKKIQQIWLHTLGNLTLTAYNSEYGDKSFEQKRDMDGGFKDSPLKLNSGLGTLAKWTEKEMSDRAQKLAAESLNIWAAPTLDDDLLKNYQTEPAVKSTYTIDDHLHLASEPMRTLFEEFRMAVQSLDPCVSVEFLKLYIAFKAETNFVDVIPQAKRLRLSLNIPFSELNDPKGICRDITGKGRWGNGDVDVGISSKEEIPYILGLVRQAFERQMLD